MSPIDPTPSPIRAGAASWQAMDPAERAEVERRLRDTFARALPRLQEAGRSFQERMARLDERPTVEDLLARTLPTPDELKALRLEFAGEPAAPPPAAEDASAYRPAKEFLDAGRFKTYKRLRAALKANPWIRTRKPSPQRLEVHAGDWHRYVAMLDAAGFDAIDVSAETEEAFRAELHRRAEQIRRRRAGS